MIFVIGEPVWFAPKERLRYILRLVTFSLAAVAGGLVLGGVLGFLGASIMPMHSFAVWVALAGLTSLVSLRETVWSRIPVPSRHWQLPRPWLQRFWGGAVVFGGAMGMGIFTITESALFYLYLLGCFMSGSFVWGAAFGAWYGLVFTLLVMYGSFAWHRGAAGGQAKKAVRMGAWAKRIGAFGAPVTLLLPAVWPF
ncbi:MAG: hypothetical protein H0W90_16210 [Actinobacteria bacterium]|nr:hypothetical protein [Actinomycetota bacterium]